LAITIVHHLKVSARISRSISYTHGAAVMFSQDVGPTPPVTHLLINCLHDLHLQMTKWKLFNLTVNSLFWLFGLFESISLSRRGSDRYQSHVLLYIRASAFPGIGKTSRCCVLCYSVL